MILVPNEEEKFKGNNQRRQHAERVVDSAMNLVGMNGGDSSNQEVIPEYDQENPFSSSMPTVSSGGTTVPTYSVDDVFNARMESTEAPVRDAAAYERVQRQQKFNAISKGLQALFGGFIAAQGEVAPSPYESGMTQQLMQNLQGIDDKYFREMADWRDQELRKEMFNANQQSQQDQARLQKMREDAQALRDQNRYEEARKVEAEAQEYARGMDQKNLALRERQVRATESRASQGTSTVKNIIPLEERGVFNQYVDQQVGQLRSQLQNENLLEEDREAIQDQIDELTMIKTYDLDDPRVSRVYDQARMAQQTQQQAIAEENRIYDGILKGQYKQSPDQLKKDLINMYQMRGLNTQQAEQQADVYMREDLGITTGGTQESPPQPTGDPIKDVIAQKEWEKKSIERAKVSNMEEKKGALKNEFASSLSLLDLDKIKELEGVYKSNPEQAISTAIKELRKKQAQAQKEDKPSSAEIKFGYTGSTEEVYKYHDQINKLERALKDLQNVQR